ncbi:MAG: flagellar type III secretion system pore protein FliP [Candidatus Caenarcaniphilales bacterium]|nr:flagellar type III secretion system pore protein FliP [Candidatus Caenarcaniphilales bacterium]
MRIFLSTLFIFLSSSLAANAAPGLNISFGDGGPQGVGLGVQILVLLTILSVAPSILLLTTSFIRFVIVFGLLRQALGLGSLPPTQVLIGLSIILTFMVMNPYFKRINDEALQPFLTREIDERTFFKKAFDPLEEFMLSQTPDSELELAIKVAHIEQPDKPEDLPMHILMVAFILSELKKAFQIGFILFLPFIVIDMISASALVSIGLMFLPPATISLPFKIVLFILVDGWNIISENLVESFYVGQ